MKLRYYLRGLGIGIIVTALLMGFVTREKLPLTDAEIKARARELGMVESDSRNLSDLQPPEDPTRPGNLSGNPSEKESEGVEPSEPAEPQTVTFTVKSGYSSDKVSKLLEEAGLVEDAGEFNRYLVKGGYANRISVGTYEIEVGASMERLAKIITKSR